MNYGTKISTSIDILQQPFQLVYFV